MHGTKLKTRKSCYR